MIDEDDLPPSYEEVSCDKWNEIKRESFFYCPYPPSYEIVSYEEFKK